MGEKNNGHYDEPAPVLQEDFVHSGSKKKECNDVFFLLLFLAVFIMTIYFAIDYGSDFIDKTTFQDTDVDSGFKAVIELVTYCGLASIGMAIVWIIIMIFAGEFLIWTALLMIIALNAAIAIGFTKYLYDQNQDYYWWPAVVFGTLAVLTALYACCIRNRIKFAAKHLKVAGSAVFSLPMMVAVAFVMVFVQLAWVVTWVLGNAGILFNSGYITVNETCTSDSCSISTDFGQAFGITFGMLVIFFWGAFVWSNVVHVTVAGSVASWKIKSGAPLITVSSWIRALTLSLGSICFGSLIVAILETIKQILNAMSWAASRSGNCVAGCLLGCISCIVGCIESCVKFFNRFAYTYVGVYGYSFLTAGKHVIKLFANKGWSAIVNDNLTGNVFFIVNLVVGGLSAWIGISLVESGDWEQELSNINEPKWIVGLSAFLVGYAVSRIFMGVMESAVTTVFVLWAEDPHGWQMTHPEHYAALHAAWLEIYPEEYNNGHGKAQSNQA